MPDQPHDEQAVAAGPRLACRWVGPVLVIAVTGEVDLPVAPELHDALQEGLNDARTSAYVVDLTGVTFFGSTGLSVLLEAAQQAQRQGQLLRVIVGTNAVVTRPIEVTGLDQVLALRDSVHDALIDLLQPDR